MSPSPYAGLSAGRRRRISADDAADPAWRPLAHLLPGLPRVGGQGSSTACPPLSDTDARALLQEALRQTVAAIATGHVGRRRPFPPD